ncbi:MAG: YbhB/YbcL family Raf kinase inhibitor-like protein, partial [Candidatus Eremiobacteraeota bacterium]|nr:YbhB/YbcL family Raf kinase inhibitor-like protein [Candidatus Eremiobacteraeota bacterium]
MKLQSADFAAGGTIPKTFMAGDCGGSNRPPSLRWSAAPAGTKSFALVLRDPDAPIPGGFNHWVVYDIAAAATSLGPALPAGAREGLRSTGKSGYYGPCPPPGPAHHYIFTLYALDVGQIAAAVPTAAQLAAKMQGHVLARAT